MTVQAQRPLSSSSSASEQVFSATGEGCMTSTTHTATQHSIFSTNTNNNTTTTNKTTQAATLAVYHNFQTVSNEIAALQQARNAATQRIALHRDEIQRVRHDQQRMQNKMKSSHAAVTTMKTTAPTQPIESDHDSHYTTDNTVFSPAAETLSMDQKLELVRTHIRASREQCRVESRAFRQACTRARKHARRLGLLENDHHSNHASSSSSSSSSSLAITAHAYLVATMRTAQPQSQQQPQQQQQAVGVEYATANSTCTATAADDEKMVVNEENDTNKTRRELAAELAVQDSSHGGGSLSNYGSYSAPEQAADVVDEDDLDADPATWKCLDFLEPCDSHPPPPPPPKENDHSYSANSAYNENNINNETDSLSNDPKHSNDANRHQSPHQQQQQQQSLWERLHASKARLQTLHKEQHALQQIWQEWHDKAQTRHDRLDQLERQRARVTQETSDLSSQISELRSLTEEAKNLAANFATRRARRKMEASITSLSSSTTTTTTTAAAPRASTIQTNPYAKKQQHSITTYTTTNRKAAATASSKVTPVSDENYHARGKRRGQEPSQRLNSQKQQKQNQQKPLPMDSPLQLHSPRRRCRDKHFRCDLVVQDGMMLDESWAALESPTAISRSKATTTTTSSAADSGWRLLDDQSDDSSEKENKY